MGNCTFSSVRVEAISTSFPKRASIRSQMSRGQSGDKGLWACGMSTAGEKYMDLPRLVKD
eukprot:744474-Amorphochlora_amoeboformis.AAC.2